MKNRRQEQGRQEKGEAFPRLGVAARWWHRSGLACSKHFTGSSVPGLGVSGLQTKFGEESEFRGTVGCTASSQRFRMFERKDIACAAFAEASVQGDVAETRYETGDPDPAEEYGPTIAQKIDDTRNFMHRVTDASETVNGAAAFMNKG